MPGNYNIGTARGIIELDASALGRAQAALRVVSLGLLGVGGVAVAGFGLAVSKAADFEQRMSAVEAVLGKGVGPAMDKIREKALTLGSTTVFSALDVAAAMEDLAKAGLSAQEIIGGAADATVQLAAASGETISLARAAEIAANAMRTFNLDAEDMTHIADQIAGAANASTLGIEDVGVSLRYVGPVAHAAGLSLDEVSAALAVLGDRGIRGSTAGTSLRGILISLTPSSKKASDAMKQLGIITEDGSNKFFDAAGNVKSLAEVSQILQDATKGLSGEQKTAALNAIFQRRAMAAAAELAKQGAEGFLKYAASIDKTSAAEVAAKRLDNLRGDITLLKSAIETTLIRAGTPFQNMLRGWVQSLTSLIRKFGELSPQTQKMIAQIIGIGGAFLTALGGLGLFSTYILRSFRAIRDLGVAIKIVITIMKSFSAAVLTNPIGLIIVAIIALIAAVILIWKNWDKIWNFIVKHKALAAVIALFAPFIAILIAVVGAVKYVWENWDTIWPKVQAVFQTVVNAIISAWDSVASFFVSAWDTISDAFATAWQTIQPILDTIASALGTAIEAVADFARAVGHQLTLVARYFDKNVMPAIEAFGDLVAAVFKDVRLGIEIAWLVIEPILSLLGTALKTAFRVAVPTIQFLISSIQRFASFLISSTQLLITTFKALWEPFWQGIEFVVDFTLTNIQNLISIFIGVVKTIWEPFWILVKGTVGTVWAAIKEIIDAAMQIITGIIKVITGIITLDWKKTWDGIKNIVAGVWNLIVGIVRGAINLLRTIIESGIALVVNFFREMPGRIVRALGNLGSLLLSHGMDVIGGLWRGIQIMWDGVLQFWRNIKNVILGFFGDAASWLIDIGKKIMEGLLEGIKKGAEAVGGFLGGLKDKIIGWKGPPEDDKVLLVNNGRLIMQSLIDGLDDKTGALRRFLTDVTGTISSLEPAVRASAFTSSGALALATPKSDNGVHVTFQFGDVLTEEAADAIVETISASDLLSKITTAVKAGKR